MDGTIDTRALIDPIDRDAMAKAPSYHRAPSARLFIGLIAGIVVVAVGGFVLLGTLPTPSRGGSGPTPLLGIGLLAAAAVAVVAVLSWRTRRIKRFRLSQFAAANGMTYTADLSYPPFPGMIFGIGSSRQSTDVLRANRPRPVEFGNYRYTVRHGKRSTTHHWGYVAVKLDVPLPNIVLDAIGNNGFGSNLPAAFQRAQRLSLEGDFDRHFTLYCPDGYERDALYLFTPDIMARFIDHAAQLDVEIIDDWLFLYTKREVSTLDPDTWAWLFSVIDALMTKLDQWARWRDDRLQPQTSGAPEHPLAPGAQTGSPAVGLLTPPPGVAPSGRRLRRSGTWIPVAFVVGTLIVWIVTRMN
ncbi:hypothetical protein [Plantibacter sp. 2H11-2]|uniref:hypothetical protein n=1 Tax=Plantibacter sp. 2H11-2 TaxID=3414431 RepID=UPI003CFB75A9